MARLGGEPDGKPLLTWLESEKDAAARAMCAKELTMTMTPLDARCQGIDVHPHLQFAVSDPQPKSQVTTLYIQEMAKRGCHGYTSFYLNAAQGDAELAQTSDAAREAFTVIRDSLATNTVEQRLECAVPQDAFRRLVR